MRGVRGKGEMCRRRWAGGIWEGEEEFMKYVRMGLSVIGGGGRRGKEGLRGKEGWGGLRGKDRGNRGN